MCIRRETREKARQSLAFSRVSKPHTHITHMLRQCTSIVYLHGYMSFSICISSSITFDKKIKNKFLLTTKVNPSCIISNLWWILWKKFYSWRTNFRGICGSTKRRIYESNEVYFYFQLPQKPLMIPWFFYILISSFYWKFDIHELKNPWLCFLWANHENWDAQI